MLKDNHQLKLALRNYMGGLNPLQHSVETYADNLMVNPSSPIPFYHFSSSFASSDSDYGSAASNSGSSRSDKNSPASKLPPILKSPFTSTGAVSTRLTLTDNHRSRSKSPMKAVRFPKKGQKLNSSSNPQWVLTSMTKDSSKKSNLLGVPVIEGVQVIRNLQKCGAL
jgi:hypothetical protein